MLLTVTALSLMFAQKLEFKTQEIDRSLTVGYATLIEDINEDGKKDIIVVDSHRVIWFEPHLENAHHHHRTDQAG